MSLQTIQESLDTLPINYQIQWEEANPESPIRIKNKLRNKEEIVQIKDTWISSISKLPQVVTIQTGKDTRIKIIDGSHTIFSNATIMVQGKGCAGKWFAANAL